jgi:hypothetical protein
MRSALETAIAAPITWVDRKEAGGSLFFVFAPVDFGHQEAVAEVSEFWRDGAARCAGGYKFSYRSSHGEWKLVLGLGWARCSVAS